MPQVIEIMVKMLATVTIFFIMCLNIGNVMYYLYTNEAWWVIKELNLLPKPARHIKGNGFTDRRQEYHPFSKYT